jgi:hypothetical protein
VLLRVEIGYGEWALRIRQLDLAGAKCRT